MTPNKTNIYKAFIPVMLFLAFNTFKLVYIDFVLTFGTQGRPYILNVIITFVLVLFIVEAMNLSKYFKPLILSFYVLQTLYLLLNITYFRYFNNYLFISTIFQNIKEGLSLVQMGAIPVYKEQLLVLIDLPFLLILLIKWQRFKISRRALTALSLLLILCFGVLFKYSYLPLQILNDRWAGPVGIVQIYGVLTLQVSDMMAVKHKGDYKTGELLSVKNSGKKKLPNVIIVQVESLDANVIGKKINNVEITPNLNRLTHKSVFFPKILSYHLAGASSDSEFSVINNVHPSDKFPSIKDTHYSFDNSFVKILTKSGYKTIAFHNNDGKYYNRSWSYPLMGYNEFVDYRDMGLKKHIWGAKDEDLFKYVSSYAAKDTEPYFYHLITMSSHIPFNLINEYHNPAFDIIKNNDTRNYINSIQYLDGVLSKFIESVGKDTLLIIYGDHTSGVHEEGVFETAACSEDNLRYEFVPMFILNSGSKNRIESEYAGSFMDIAPTILSYTGLNFEYYTFGENLLSENPLSKKVPFMGKMFDRKYLENVCK